MILSFVLLMLGGGISWYNGSFDISTVIWFVLGLVYLGIFLFEYTAKYLVIKDGYLQKNGIVRKKIKLEDVEDFQMFAGDYIFKTKDTELIVPLVVMDREEIQRLDDILREYGIGVDYKGEMEES